MLIPLQCADRMDTEKKKKMHKHTVRYRRWPDRFLKVHDHLLSLVRSLIESMTRMKDHISTMSYPRD